MAEPGRAARGRGLVLTAPLLPVLPKTAQTLPAQSRREADVVRLSRLAPDDPARSALRGQVVEAHLPLVRHLARRYRDHGEPLDDLMQVGTIGLIQAVDRFDAGREIELASYATPFILGEIRRHFRDRTTAVRLPRRLTELQPQIRQARDVLAQSLGRSPTVSELAEYLGRDAEEIIEALDAGRSCVIEPLTSDDGRPGGAYGDAQLRDDDGGLDGVIDRETLRPILSRLPSRQKQILALRFLRGMSQSEIADELGISQMHVSRLLRRTVAELTECLSEIS